MCDTVVATGSATADGVTIFGKNSDREPNEAQHLLLVPAVDHPAGSKVRCTYVEIPQVPHTYSILLAKPFWIWGAEMGANEHGLVIGNEAVFTRVPYGNEPGLIGMDFLRLALERADTAERAVMVITELLAEHGQSGNCGYQHKLFYHNSFLIADPHDAWVLETAGPHWAARRVEGVYTISNRLTLENEWDLASPELVSYAAERGWCKGRADFSFARCYSDFIYTTFSDAAARRKRTMELLTAQAPEIDVLTVMDALRDHGGDERWRPDRGLVGTTVCAHASFGPARNSQTTGSMVSRLDPASPQVHFLSGTAAPCTSILKPVWLDAVPDFGPEPDGTFDAQTLFWRHERLHRRTLEDYRTFVSLYRDERDALQASLVQDSLAVREAGAAERLEVAVRALDASEAAEERWTARVTEAAPRHRRGWLHRWAWRHHNRRAGIL